MAGSALNPFFSWQAPGIADDNARFHASINTCNGCHGPDTNTSFLMVNPRLPGSQATLSPFLTGTFVSDGVLAQTLNDLARRRADLTSLVCGSDGGVAEGGVTEPGDASVVDAASDAARVAIDGGVRPPPPPPIP
jgi:hypothetical protein